MARCEKQEVYYEKPKAQHKINEESFRREKPGHPSAVQPLEQKAIDETVKQSLKQLGS